jgi:hypothetical protein
MGFCAMLSIFREQRTAKGPYCPPLKGGLSCRNDRQTEPNTLGEHAGMAPVSRWVNIQEQWVIIIRNGG